MPGGSGTPQRPAVHLAPADRSRALGELAGLVGDLTIRNDGQALALLAAVGVPLDVRQGESQQTPLQLASCLDHEEAQRALRAAGADRAAWNPDPDCAWAEEYEATQGLDDDGDGEEEADLRDEFGDVSL